MRWILLIAVALAGCGGGDEEQTAVERFCARLHTCQNIAATMDYGACVDRYQSLSDEPCMECIGGLTCAGLEEALINGRNLCEAECGPM